MRRSDAKGRLALIPGKPRPQFIAPSPPFGRYIVRQRLLAGISQSSLAAALGVSTRTLSSLENGRRPLFDVGEAETLARVLDISVSDLQEAAERSRMDPQPIEDAELRESIAQSKGIALAYGPKLLEAMERDHPEFFAAMQLVQSLHDSVVDAFLEDDPLPVMPAFGEDVLKRAGLDATAEGLAGVGRKARQAAEDQTQQEKAREPGSG